MKVVCLLGTASISLKCTVYISKKHEGTKIALSIWIPTLRDLCRDAHSASLTDCVLI